MEVEQKGEVDAGWTNMNQDNPVFDLRMQGRIFLVEFECIS